MAKETKASEYEKDQRIEIVMSLISRFMSRSQIMQYVAKKTDWNIATRQIDEYISEAKTRLRERVDPEDLKAKINKNFEMLFSKNMSIEDFKECRAILESLAKLHGSNEPTKHQHEGKFDITKLYNADQGEVEAVRE